MPPRARSLALLLAVGLALAAGVWVRGQMVDLRDALAESRTQALDQCDVLDDLVRVIPAVAHGSPVAQVTRALEVSFTNEALRAAGDSTWRAGPVTIVPDPDRPERVGDVRVEPGFCGPADRSAGSVDPGARGRPFLDPLRNKLARHLPGADALARARSREEARIGELSRFLTLLATASTLPGLDGSVSRAREALGEPRRADFGHSAGRLTFGAFANAQGPELFVSVELGSGWGVFGGPREVGESSKRLE